jgi:hypothetical protein
VLSVVRKRLVALRFGGTTEILHGEISNFAGGQIEPVAVQHCSFTFQKFHVIILTKTAVKPRYKVNDSRLNAN